MSRSSARIIFLLATPVFQKPFAPHVRGIPYFTTPLNMDGTVFYMSPGAGVVVKYSSGSHDVRGTPVW